MESRNPHDLITTSGVTKALVADKGADAILKSFKIVNFTSVGDNWASLVTSVVVEYELGSKPCEVTYVVKVNPCRPGTWSKVVDIIFNTEMTFFSRIVPLINKVLSDSNKEPLKVAKFYHAVDTAGEQIIYLEDLRASGFKMHSRQNTMDKAHIDLILAELGRLHGASSIMFSENKNLRQELAFLNENHAKVHAIFKQENLDLFGNAARNVASLMSKVPDYEYVSKFLFAKAETINEDFIDLMKADEPFNTLSHGDSWNNNILFRSVISQMLIAKIFIIGVYIYILYYYHLCSVYHYTLPF